MNVESRLQEVAPDDQGQSRVPPDPTPNQMNLSRWRFLLQAPEAEAVLRKALLQPPDVPERAGDAGQELDAWVGRGPGSGGATPSGPGGDQGPPGWWHQRPERGGRHRHPDPCSRPLNPHHDEDKNQPGSS